MLVSEALRYLNSIKSKSIFKKVTENDYRSPLPISTILC